MSDKSCRPEPAQAVGQVEIHMMNKLHVFKKSLQLLILFQWLLARFSSLVACWHLMCLKIDFLLFSGYFALADLEHTLTHLGSVDFCIRLVIVLSTFEELKSKQCGATS
ncbi:hypothetical protein QQ045_000706 [Rhodiola kirilowii]